MHAAIEIRQADDTNRGDQRKQRRRQEQEGDDDGNDQFHYRRLFLASTVFAQVFLPSAAIRRRGCSPARPDAPWVRNEPGKGDGGKETDETERDCDVDIEREAGLDGDDGDEANRDRHQHVERQYSIRQGRTHHHAKDREQEGHAENSERHRWRRPTRWKRPSSESLHDPAFETVGDAAPPPPGRSSRAHARRASCGRRNVDRKRAGRRRDEVGEQCDLEIAVDGQRRGEDAGASHPFSGS